MLILSEKLSAIWKCQRRQTKIIHYRELLHNLDDHTNASLRAPKDMEVTTLQ